MIKRTNAWCLVQEQDKTNPTRKHLGFKLFSLMPDPPSIVILPFRPDASLGGIQMPRAPVNNHRSVHRKGNCYPRSLVNVFFVLLQCDNMIPLFRIDGFLRCQKKKTPQPELERPLNQIPPVISTAFCPPGLAIRNQGSSAHRAFAFHFQHCISLPHSTKTSSLSATNANIRAGAFMVCSYCGKNLHLQNIKPHNNHSALNRFS